MEEAGNGVEKRTKKQMMRGIVRKRWAGRVEEAGNGVEKHTKKQMMRGIVCKKRNKESGRAEKNKIQ